MVFTPTVKLRHLRGSGLSAALEELINKNWFDIEVALSALGVSTNPNAPPPIFGTNDHHLLINLAAFDDHPQYLYLAGRSPTQIVFPFDSGATTGILILKYLGSNAYFLRCRDASNNTLIDLFRSAGSEGQIAVYNLANNVITNILPGEINVVGGGIVVEGVIITSGSVVIPGTSNSGTPLKIHQFSGAQTGDLTKWMNAADTVELLAIDKDGNISAGASGSVNVESDTTNLRRVGGSNFCQFNHVAAYSNLLLDGYARVRGVNVAADPLLELDTHNQTGNRALVLRRASSSQTANLLENMKDSGESGSGTPLSYIDKDGKWVGPVSAVGVGNVPIIVAEDIRVDQGADIGSSGSPITLYTPGTAGMYRLNFFMQRINIGMGADSLSLFLTYTSRGQAVDTNIANILLATSPAEVVGGSIMLHSDASTAIGFYVDETAAGTPTWDVRLMLESLDI